MLRNLSNGVFMKCFLMLVALLIVFTVSGNNITNGEQLTNESKLFTDVIHIETGMMSSFAITKDGTVWGWGGNSQGNLGNGAKVNPYSPVKIDIDHVISISSASRHTLFLKDDGTVWVSGANDNDILGVGTSKMKEALTPIKIEGLSDIIAISASSYHSMALDKDGKVWVWGSNAEGQLGDSSLTSSNVPVQVKGLPTIKQIQQGKFQSYALQENGDVWTWGIEKVGASEPNIIRQPTIVKEISQVQTLVDIYGTVAALKEDGTVWMWNSYTYFEEGETLKPKVVSGLKDVVSLSGGYQIFMAVKSDGTVWSWKPHLDSNIELKQVSNIKDAVSISSGDDYHIVLLKNGQLLSMGSNKYGQLGLGIRDKEVTIPQKVKKSVTVSINGASVELAIPPMVINGVSYVPLRGVFEEIGAKVEWSSATKSVTITKDSKKIVLDTRTNVNSFFINDSVMVPLRYISESLGAEVKWDNVNYSIKITAATK